MSAFIVDDDCINRIVSHLNRNARDFEWLLSRSGYTLSQSEDLQRLASDLYLMNCDAVDGRYGPGTSAQDDAGRAGEFQFKFSPPIYSMPLPAVVIYKAAKCLRYQCSEGDVPQRPLFKLLDDIIASIADDIVTKMPAYDKANWG